MNVRPVGYVLAMLLVVSTATAVGADRPPKDLHWTGDHWTPWNPPAPPADVQVYKIVRGDTLWGIAKRTYGNPYLWPQIWEKNQYILDAHWIYPGDPLVLGPEVAPAEKLAAEGTGTAEPATEAGEPEPSKPVPGVLNAGAAASPPSPLGAESDIYCSGYVGDVGETFPYSIVGTEYDALSPRLLDRAGAAETGTYGVINTAKYGLSTGDLVYLDGGSERGLTPGQLFTIVEPAQRVIHPVSRQLFGRFFHYVGRVRVLSVQEKTAIAEIVHSCDPVMVGSRLIPFQAEPVPLGRRTAMRPVNYPTAAEKLADAPTIIFSQDDIVSMGEDHVVYIDRGAQADVTPGDVYTIYRQNRPGLPPVILGELAILSVHPKSSVARIIRSRYEIFVGDRLEVK
jgi:nucleoid-associated protein YgaU